MTGKQKTAAEQKQSRLEKALRENLMRRKAQAKARTDCIGPLVRHKPDEKLAVAQKQPDESHGKR